jgi:HK97 family phage major capsid protein
MIGAISDLTPGGSGILPDSLVDLVYSLNSAYRANGTFAMNSLTMAAVRKLKDTTNRTSTRKA